VSPGGSTERGDPSTPVVAVVTHNNLPGLRLCVPSLRAQADGLDWRFVVVDCASSPETKEWLRAHRPALATVPIDTNVGPGAARNAAIRHWPEADSYFFFDDDVIPHGRELSSLFVALHSDAHVAIASGIPVDEMCVPLTATFSRRPFARAFPHTWNRWWGEGHGLLGTSIRWTDVAPGSAVAVRGAAVRGVGGFDPEYWPAGFEDLDLCAKVHFSGYGVVVDPRVQIRQQVSVTMNKVFGQQYPILRRSSAVLYALVDYPVPFAFGRLVRAFIGAVLPSPNPLRRGDAGGLLRGAKEWRYVLRARKFRRRLRGARNQKLAYGQAGGNFTGSYR